EAFIRRVRVTRGGIDPVARVLCPPTVFPGRRCVRRPIRCRLPIDQRLRRPYRRPAGHAPARGHLVRLAQEKRHGPCRRRLPHPRRSPSPCPPPTSPAPLSLRSRSTASSSSPAALPG